MESNHRQPDYDSGALPSELRCVKVVDGHGGFEPRLIAAGYPRASARAEYAAPEMTINEHFRGHVAT